MAQFITDIRHLAPVEGFVDLPEGAWQFRDYLGRIVSAATSRANLVSFISGLPCRVKIGRKKCQGTLSIKRQDMPSTVITWQCTSCDEGGEISGWRGHLYDQSKDRAYNPEPGEKYLSIDLTGEEFTALLESENTYDLDSDKIILTGEKTTAGVKISGWEGDMDNFVGYIAANSNHTENKKMEKLLDAVFGKIQKKLDDCFETSVLQ